MVWKIILEFSSHLITVLALLLLASFFPSANKKQLEKEYNFEELEKIYKKYDIYGSFIFIVITPLTIYGLYCLFSKITPFFETKHEEYLYFIRTQDLSWWLSGGLTITFISLIVDIFFRSMMDYDKLLEYEIYSNMKNGIDGRRFVKGWIVLCSILSIIGFELANDSYFGVKGNMVEYNFLERLSPDKYLFDEIYKIEYITETPRGIFRVEPYYKVYFKDSIIWNTDQIPSKQPMLSQMIKYLSVHSKRRIDSLHVLNISYVK